MSQIPTFQTTGADFTQRINLNNQFVKIRLVFNSRVNCWFMDFTDSINITVYGIKIVPDFPLLQAHKAYLSFSGDLMVFKTNLQVEDIITYDNLNSGQAFLYLTSDEVNLWKANNGL